MKTTFDKNHYKSAITNRNSRILEFVPKREFDGKTILEVGAGIGLPGSEFEKLGATVTSVDGREENVKEGKSRFPEREWHLLNFEDTSLEEAIGDRKFDYILCLGLLYHLTNPQDLIKELANHSDVVFYSGIVVDSTDPEVHFNVQEISQGTSQDQHLEGFLGSRYSYVWLENQFKEAGYEVTDITPTKPASWCTWLHEGNYVNDGDFRKSKLPGHTRKMYIFKK
jgi:SAM-dependent methyltransferase